MSRPPARRVFRVVLCASLAAWGLSPRAAFAAARSSLFRGVVLADSPIGVRVVSVEDASQAFFGDLRAEDVIVSVNDEEVHSIDEFAALSGRLKGQAIRARLVIFRRGSPLTLQLHLFSDPLLRVWGIEFIPEDLRFAQPEVGLAYWTRLGRGFTDAGKPSDALHAYLNGLHNVPTDLPAAMQAADLLCQVSRRRLADRQLAEGLTRLRQSVVMLQRLFNQPLTDEQLQTVKQLLEDALQALRQLAARQSA